MKIYKSQYGWSTSAHSKDLNGQPIRYYLDCNFKKNEEPIGEEIEGKLIFRQEDGTERECFLSSYLKKGVATPKLVLMGSNSKAKPKEDYQAVLNDGVRDITGHNVEIDVDELPFY